MSLARTIVSILRPCSIYDRSFVLYCTFLSRQGFPRNYSGPAYIRSHNLCYTRSNTFRTAMPENKQATLGKFFGNPNGAKPAPKQSTLAFSKPSSAVKTKEDEEDKSKASMHTKAGEPRKSDAPVRDIDGDIAMSEHDQEVKPKQDSDEGDHKAHATNGHAISSPVHSPPRKRQGSVESDDEPPIKRQRVQTKPKSAALDKDIPDNKEKQKSTPMKPKKGEPEVKREEADEEDEVSLPGAAAKAADESDDLAAEEASSDVESEVDSEEDRPEQAAKVRETIQTTLSSKGKDPYPDWAPGEPVPYAALCTTFSKIEMTTKRLEIQAHSSLFLRQILRLTPQDVLPTILLMINKLAADYTGIELGIGESFIMKAIGESTGRALKDLKVDYSKIGELGLVAAKSRSNQPTMFKPKPLTVRGVHEGLMAIATMEGKGSQDKKVGGIKKLLSAADAHLAGKGSKGVDITKDKGGASECKFIVRTLEGKMRLGLADKTVLIALSQAMVAHEQLQKNDKAPSTEALAKGENILKSVYSELPSYEVIVPVMLKHGLVNLRDKCKLQPGVPLKPMLAKPTKSITEVLDRFEGKDFTCEYKYDGERAQIHFVAHGSSEEYATAAPSAGKNEKGVSNIFSRNSEDLSKKYPDILAKLPTWIKEGTSSFVLDCETVAWDLEEKKVLPFQQLMTRKRKDVKVEDVKVQVCVFAFDILFLNGSTLVTTPFRERRELMHSAFQEVEGEFTFAKYGNTNELDKIQILLEESVKASCEGLMVKMLDGVESNYEPSRRSQNWLKVKKDYLSGVGDSLDLVVLGAYYGKGKRTSVYGAFLLACYNASTQNFETVCNIGTGFSEALLEELHLQLEPLIIDRPKSFYSHSAGNKDQPDVWFEAKHVWEVKTADLTLSPRYKAASEQLDGKAGGKGISLRFPRFLKVRDDKKAEDATTSRAVAEMYSMQEGVTKAKGPSVDDDFEY